MRIVISIKLVKIYFVLQRVICANIISHDHGVSSVCSPGPKSEELRTAACARHRSMAAPSVSALLCPGPGSVCQSRHLPYYPSSVESGGSGTRVPKEWH